MLLMSLFAFILLVHIWFIDVAFEISSSNQIQNISVTYLSIFEILVSSLLICQNHQNIKSTKNLLNLVYFWN